MSTRSVIGVAVLAIVAGFVGGSLATLSLQKYILGEQARVQPGPLVPVVQPPRGTSSLRSPFTAVAQALDKSVVNIDTKRLVRLPRGPDSGEDLFRRFFGGEGPWFPFPRSEVVPRVGQGSGFIIRSDGIILTNQHVVEEAKEIKVTLLGDKVYKGRVLGADWFSDLALVKIDAENLPAAPLGDSDQIKPGDWAIAIGNPFGFEHTITVGVISALGRPIGVGKRGYEQMIQTDVLIDPGNSGGPLADITGRVIGVNTAIFVGGGMPGVRMGFAIPINLAKKVAEELLARGKVIRPWIGIVMSTVNEELAKEESLPVKEGTFIRQVLPASPAYGILKDRDIITAVNGRQVRNAEDASTLIRGGRVGTTFTFEVLRLEGLRWAKVTVRVKAGERPQRLEE